MNINKIKLQCRSYLIARKKFLDFSNNCHLLSGNDNIIGSRIGEFIAWNFLNKQKRSPQINKKSNVKDFDIICKNNNAKVTVKLISAENKTGRTTRIGKNWDEFLLIILDKKYKVSKIGHITKKQFKKANKFGGVVEIPLASRSMFAEKGLFSKYGKIYSDNSIKTLV